MSGPSSVVLALLAAASSVQAAEPGAVEPKPAMTATAAPPPVDGAEPSGERWTVFPLASFAPETSVQLSAFVVYSFGGLNDNALSPTASRSNVSVVAAYTLKNQFTVALSPTLYLDRAVWRLAGSLQALRYPDVFYELGPDSSPASREQFTERAVLGSVSAERIVVGRLRVGGQIGGFAAQVTRFEPGGMLADGTLPGSRGGVGYGIGPIISWDDRDRELNPQRGGRHTLSLFKFPSVAGADFSYSQLTADLRQYVPTPWSGQLVAVQVFSELSFGRPPFQLMPTLGGDSRMRGFFASRFRDLHTVSAQIEYRAAIWWRLGLVGFAGVGDVAGGLDKFVLKHFRAAGGLGLRVALDKKEGINLRIDVGHTSTGDTNLYVSVGEAF